MDRLCFKGRDVVVLGGLTEKQRENSRENFRRAHRFARSAESGGRPHGRSHFSPVRDTLNGFLWGLTPIGKIRALLGGAPDR